MDITSELVKSLSNYLNWNKARLNCFVQMIVAVINVRTVNLTEWATTFVGDAKHDSAYVRIRRFFRQYQIDFDVIANLMFNWFGFSGQSVYLTLDRTQWQLGKYNINILMLGVVYQGIAIPLYWSLLNKRGSSNYQERVDLISRFISYFGCQCVKGLLGDREFIGKQWFEYLKKNNIPYYIRIKESMLVSNSKGHMTNAKFLFTGLKRCEKRILSGKRKISGLELFIAGVRCPDGGYLIIATTEAPENAIEIYRYRWQIETLFGCLKTRGFNVENTHLTEPERLMKMIAVLAISFAWAHKIGEWHSQITPILIKKHGRKAESIFRRGLKNLRKLLFSNPGTRLIQKIIQILFLPPDQLKTIKLGLNL